MQQRLLFLLFWGFTVTLQAQDNSDWSLQKCIDYAFQNSLQVQQANLAKAQALLSKKQAQWAQAPTLNASFRHGINFGRSIDLTSYSFNTIPTQTSTLSVNANVILFQGLQIRNTIKQTKVDEAAAEKDLEQAKNDVALAVAQAYLSILLAEESKRVLEEQAKITKAQFDQTIKLIEAGVLAENSRYDLEAQMARDEENIVGAENSIELAYVNLKVAMNYDVGEGLSIEVPPNLLVPTVEQLPTLNEVYTEAIASQPSITAAKLRQESAMLGVSIAKGALYPTLSLYGGINTNFSSAARNPVFGTTQDTFFGNVLSSQDPVLVTRDRQTISSGDVTPYFLQLGGNTSANVGINLSIPIFNGLRTRIGIDRAKLAVKTAELSKTQLEVTLKSNIDRALTDVRAAQKRLIATQKSVVATRLSVENTRRRYELGVVNSFELTSVQNTLIASESSVLQAKYDYLFRLKILDYYRGRPIKIQ